MSDYPRRSGSSKNQLPNYQTLQNHFVQSSRKVACGSGKLLAAEQCALEDKLAEQLAGLPAMECNGEFTACQTKALRVGTSGTRY